VLASAANASSASGNAPLHAKQVLRSLRVPVARHVCSSAHLFLEARARAGAVCPSRKLAGSELPNHARKESRAIVGLLVVNLLRHTEAHEPKATAITKATSTGHWAKSGNPNAGA